MNVNICREIQPKSWRKARQATIPKKQITTARLCKQLPLGYKPDDNDVYCGRGRKCSFHVGNQRFREIIVANVHRYVSATTRSEKSTIIYEMVDYIRHLCVTTGHGIGFIKRDHISGLYYEAGDMIAREKVSQAFRDATSGRHLFYGLVSPTGSDNLEVNTGEKCPTDTTHLHSSLRQMQALEPCAESDAFAEKDSFDNGVTRSISIRYSQTTNQEQASNVAIASRYEVNETRTSTEQPIEMDFVSMEGYMLRQQQLATHPNLVRTSHFITRRVDRGNFDRSRDRCKFSNYSYNKTQQEDSSATLVKRVISNENSKKPITDVSVADVGKSSNDNDETLTFFLLLNFSLQQQMSSDPFDLEPLPLP